MKLSKHAKLKIHERKIEEAMVENVLQKPESLYYDIVSMSMVAIGKVTILNIETNLVVPFIREGDDLKVITVYP